MTTKELGQVITFYSYKGGTGRTMALANVAALLSNRNKVLMIDWDLEAPGLHYFHGLKEPFSKPGLIDLFEEIKSQIESEQRLGLEKYSDDLFSKINLDKYLHEITGGRLFLLAAGTLGRNYARQVTSFQWEALFNQAPWLFRSLASFLSQSYDYVLIDSRTGLNDISGICTALMPEKLVAVFTPNSQSVSGLSNVIKSALSYREESEDLRILNIFPLPSRIELQEKELLDRWRFGAKDEDIEGYQPLFEQLLTESYRLEKCNLEKYFDEIQIQQQTYYAFGEKIAVLEQQGVGRLSLKTSYEVLTEKLVNGIAPWVDVDPESEVTFAPYKYDVFLSHNNNDKNMVEEIASKLQDAGINVWLDSWNLIAGMPWQETVEKALRESSTIAVFIGASGTPKWEIQKIEEISSESKRNVIPVLLPNANVKQIKKGSFLSKIAWVDFRKGLKDRETFNRLVTGIRGETAGEITPKRQVIPFFNRQEETSNIISTTSSKYFLVQAPSGYGKSYLLLKLKDIFEDRHWQNAYITVSPDMDLVEIAKRIARQLGVRLENKDTLRPGISLAGALKKLFAIDPEKSSSLVFFFDFEAPASANLFDKVLNEFIPDIVKNLNTLRNFQSEEMQFKVVFAGRNLGSLKAVKTTNLPLEIRSLSPFTYSIVKVAVESIFPHLTAQAKQLLAAHTFFLSGGHPSSVGKILDSMRENALSPDDFIELHQVEIQDAIISAAKSTLDDLPMREKKYVTAFSNLAIFRYVNYFVLDTLRKSYDLQFRDTFDFEDMLTANYTLTRNQYLLQDSSRRRLLIVYLRNSQPGTFINYCKQARIICQDILNSDDIQYPTKWVLEYLFQWLQEKSAKKIETNNSRKILQTEFFENIIPHSIGLYLGRHARLSQSICREDQRALISELTQPDQWEFEFLLNYCLRGVSYDEYPFEKLKSRIVEVMERKYKEIQE